MKLKSIWTVSVLAVYLYALTILTQYGFYTYFNIPPDFIEASLAGNTFFLYGLVQIFINAFTFNWLFTLVVSVYILFLLIALYLMYACNFQNLFPWLVLIVALVLLFNAPALGRFFAKVGIYFPTVISACVDVAGPNDANFIVAAFYHNQAVLVPVDVNNKMNGGFVVRDTATLPCKIEYRNIGHVSS